MENRTIHLKDLIIVKARSDAVEVSAKEKSQIYSGRNPLIWSETTQTLASGASGGKLRQT